MMAEKLAGARSGGESPAGIIKFGFKCSESTGSL